MAENAPVGPSVLSMNSWTRIKTEDIRNECDFDGGWEVWAQVELTLWWKGTKSIKITHEEKLYGDCQRADLKMVQNNVTAIVELKCKTKAETGSAFATRLKADYAKLQTLGSGDRWVYGLLARPSDGTDIKDHLTAAVASLNATKKTKIGVDEKFLKGKWYFFLTDPEEIHVFWAQPL